MYYSRYCRSILFTPALRRERFLKALRTGADISLLDLEDSVSPLDKGEARAQVGEFLALKHELPEARLAVRVNGLCDPEGLADLLAVRAAADKPDVVMIPKVESARDVEIVESVLGAGCARLELMAIIETARGLTQAGAIAAASPRLKALVFGSADFSMSINASMDWESLYVCRAQIVLAARAAGIHAVDTATFDIDDEARLMMEATRTRDMGFSGKAAIHPRQVAAINQAFSPDAVTLARARAIVAQAEASHGNICVVDGMMVGIPIVEAARRTLSEFSDVAGATLP